MAKEITFFDSNVFIAASILSHEHYLASNACLARLQHGGGACASHTLAEVYNTLTSFPKGYGVPPDRALHIVQHASETYKLVALTPTETLHTIEEASRHGLKGAIIYDALLMACARKIDATRIFTLNRKHFQRVAPDLASRIAEP